MAEQEIAPTDDGSDESAPAPEPAPAPRVEVPNLPLFGKWDSKDVTIRDAGLARYINLESIGMPHHGGRGAMQRFGKQRVPIVERLINGMMRTEKYTGKKQSATKIVREAFDIIHDKGKMHPIQALVDAIHNAAPKEETTRLRYGGISVPKAVDTAPLRRVDLALRHLTSGAVKSSHKNAKPAARCLADEILKAAKGDPSSVAVSKKDEVERVAKSAR